MCREFGVVNSTIQMIWKHNTKTVSKFERMDQEYSDCFKPEWSDFDKALLKWFEQERSDNVQWTALFPE